MERDQFVIAGLLTIFLLLTYADSIWIPIHGPFQVIKHQIINQTIYRAGTCTAYIVKMSLGLTTRPDLVVLATCSEFTCVFSE